MMTITIAKGRYRSARRRPAWATRLGSRLQPAAVTDAWYEAGCPQGFVPPLSLRVRAQWRLACWLRGATMPNRHRRSFWLGFGPVATLLALLVAVVLTACGGTTTELDPAADAESAPVETSEPAPPPAPEPAPEPESEPTVEPEPTPEPEPEPAEPEFTVAQEQAIGSAQDYLSFTAFSKSGLVEQLEYEGFSQADAEFAVEHITVDWNEQAVKSGQSYLDMTHFSRSGLIEQLEYEGFSTAQATYAVDQLGL